MTKEQNIAPSVAAYALFSTDLVRIDTAMDFIFERRQEDEGNKKAGKMQHPFIPYVPEGTTQDEAKEDDTNQGGDTDSLQDELGDIELGDMRGSQHEPEFASNEVCFICQNPAAQHDPIRRDSFYSQNQDDLLLKPMGEEEMLKAAMDQDVGL